MDLIIEGDQFEICLRFLVQIGLLSGLFVFLSVLVDDDELNSASIVGTGLNHIF